MHGQSSSSALHDAKALPEDVAIRLLDAAMSALKRSASCSALKPTYRAAMLPYTQERRSVFDGKQLARCPWLRTREAAKHIICLVSDSNWDLVSGLVMRHLTTQQPDPDKLQILAHCYINTQRLSDIFISEARGRLFPINESMLTLLL